MLASFRLTFISHRVEYSGSIADLPPALEKPDCYCDPCKKKGVMTKTAKVFCTECKRKYCANHEEVNLMIKKCTKFPVSIGLEKYRTQLLLG